MRRMCRMLAAVTVLVFVVSATAEAVTIRDVVELSKAGLSDDVLLALIDVDRSVFAIDTATLKMLKQSGVSEVVIVAMIRSGRAPAAQPIPQVEPTEPPIVAASPEPQVIVIDHHDPIEVPVPIPVAIPVYLTAPRGHLPVNRPARVPVGNDLSPQDSDLSPRPTEHDRHPCRPPVYWGFGGKLRPGSWEPPQVCR